jgi:hypothetical protein
MSKNQQSQLSQNGSTTVVHQPESSETEQISSGGAEIAGCGQSATVEQLYQNSWNREEVLSENTPRVIAETHVTERTNSFHISKTWRT